MSAYRQQQISVLGVVGGDDEIVGASSSNPSINRRAETTDAPRSSFIPSSLRRIVVEMADLSLLRHRGFLVICVVQMLAFLGFYIPFVFVGARSTANGAEATAAALLLSYMGVANTIGRVASGWMADRQWTSALNLSSLSLLVTGACSIMLTTTHAYSAAVVYALVFGLVIAAFVSLTSVVLVEQVGLERLTNAYGLLCVARGLALFFGSPLGGFMYDLTDDFDVVFSLSGCLFMAAGALGCLLHVLETKSGVKLKVRD